MKYVTKRRCILITLWKIKNCLLRIARVRDGRRATYIRRSFDAHEHHMTAALALLVQHVHSATCARRAVVTVQRDGLFTWFTVFWICQAFWICLSIFFRAQRGCKLRREARRRAKEGEGRAAQTGNNSNALKERERKGHTTGCGWTTEKKDPAIEAECPRYYFLV